MDELMLEQLHSKEILKHLQKCLKVLCVWSDAIVCIVFNFATKNVNAMYICTCFVKRTHLFRKVPVFNLMSIVPPSAAKKKKNPNTQSDFLCSFQLYKNDSVSPGCLCLLLQGGGNQFLINTNLAKPNQRSRWRVKGGFNSPFSALLLSENWK